VNSISLGALEIDGKRHAGFKIICLLGEMFLTYSPIKINSSSITALPHFNKYLLELSFHLRVNIQETAINSKSKRIRKSCKKHFILKTFSKG
jgi:hypothetical protein